MRIGDVVGTYVVEQALAQNGDCRLFVVRHATLHSMHVLKCLMDASPALNAAVMDSGQVAAHRMLSRKSTT